MVRGLAGVILLLALPIAANADWKPAKGPLMTRWATTVSPSRVHPEYPRPQMVRDRWLNLNGLWDYAIRPRDEDRPSSWDGQILVPFAAESALSGVMKQVGPANRLWYRRTFELPRGWNQRALLHFGAVDWETTVWVNGVRIGDHRGGYDPFALDATSALRKGGPQEIVIAVWDPSDAGFQARGKQVRRPEGIWYTPTTGIWQTVWLEPVPMTSIERIKIVPDVDSGSVSVSVDPLGADADGIKVSVMDGRNRVGEAASAMNSPAKVRLPNPKLWTPDTPFLYDLKVSLTRDGKTVDEVKSYFGMRKTSLGKDADGITRLMLNNKFVFQFGPLDQGFWPDGLYTAPNDDALRYDIEMTKKFGFNMARKHVKVEPARWYYWCDKLGLLVWQDMPSGDRYIGSSDPDITRVGQSARQFETEWQRIIEANFNSPSIVMWVPFNEGWGQYDTARIASFTRSVDPTRLVNSASGWTDRGVGDVHDIHVYPGPASPQPESRRAAVLGEFGGLGLPLKGHTWQDEKNWGYRSFTTSEALTTAYVDLLTRLRPLIKSPGLSAAVYTQTTDVEIEVNGLMTYDRALVKMPLDRIAEAARKVYLPPPSISTVVPTSQRAGQAWRYLTTAPPAGWFAPDFNDSTWTTGIGGFGQTGTLGSVVRTQWTNNDIWLRRSFDLPAGARLSNPHLFIHHDEDAEVYLNGLPVAKLTGFTTDYVFHPLTAEGRVALKPGKNTLAVHVKQTRGGQYIDVGIVDVVEPPARN